MGDKSRDCRGTIFDATRPSPIQRGIFVASSAEDVAPEAGMNSTFSGAFAAGTHNCFLLRLRWSDPLGRDSGDAGNIVV